MNTLTVILAIFFFLILLALGFAFVTIWRAWKTLPQRGQMEYYQAIASKRRVILLLIPIAILPWMTFFALRFQPLVSLALGLIWGGITFWYWEHEVQPNTKFTWENEDTIPFPYLPRPTQTPDYRPDPLPIPQLKDQDLVHKNFSWYFASQDLTQSFEMDISQSRFEKFHQESRLQLNQWSHYVRKEMPEIRVLAIQFQNLHLEHNWCTFQQASNILSFIQQCISYTADQDTTDQSEWPRYPIETLMEETGDCEDVAILAAAILTRLGFQTALLEYPHHMALGIAGADDIPGHFIEDHKLRKRYFYAEATAQGWHIGEIPEDYLDVPPKRIIPIEILLET